VSYAKHREAVMKKYQGKCHLCGEDYADAIDHVVPQARGGSDHPDNLRPAHTTCNSKKRDRHWPDWANREPTMWVRGKMPAPAERVKKTRDHVQGLEKRVQKTRSKARAEGLSIEEYKAKRAREQERREANERYQVAFEEALRPHLPTINRLKRQAASLRREPLDPDDSWAGVVVLSLIAGVIMGLVVGVGMLGGAWEGFLLVGILSTLLVWGILWSMNYVVCWISHFVHTKTKKAKARAAEIKDLERQVDDIRCSVRVEVRQHLESEGQEVVSIAPGSRAS